MSQTPRGFHPAPNWPRPRHRLAISLWCGFLGASLMLLGIIMVWDHVWPDAPRADWPTLAVLFGLGWLCTSLTALMSLSLDTPPRTQFLPDDPEDEIQ